MPYKWEVARYGREAANKYRKEHAKSGYSTARFRERKYGVTPEMYDEKLKAQGGVCAICYQPPHGNAGRPSLCVDHDHEHGRLRDLLCQQCNRLLGQANDNPDVLLEAVAYLKKWKMKFLFGD